MTGARFAVKTIHHRAARYLKRQEQRVRDEFEDMPEHICDGPFEITVYEFGPRGDVYR